MGRVKEYYERLHEDDIELGMLYQGIADKLAKSEFGIPVNVYPDWANNKKLRDHLIDIFRCFPTEETAEPNNITLEQLLTSDDKNDRIFALVVELVKKRFLTSSEESSSK